MCTVCILGKHRQIHYINVFGIRYQAVCEMNRANRLCKMGYSQSCKIFVKPVWLNLRNSSHILHSFDKFCILDMEINGHLP